jgi:hypothetical protein
MDDGPHRVVQVLPLLANGAVALVLAFPVHAAEHIVSLIIILVTNRARCRDAEANWAGAGQRFADFAFSLSVPLHLIAGPAESSPVRSCPYVLSWMQITGFVVSLAKVFIEETTARCDFEQLRRGPAAVNLARPPRWGPMYSNLFIVSYSLWCLMSLFT